MTTTRTWMLAITCTTAAVPLAAQEPLVTDRPDFTESAAAVEPGRLQLEAGYTLSETGGERTHAVGEVLLRWGVLEAVELRIGINSFLHVEGPISDESGWEDLSLGGKVELKGPDRRRPVVPALALLIGTTLPTGSNGMGASALQPGAILAAAWELPERLGLGANVGWSLLDGEGGTAGEWSGSVAVGGALGERLGMFAEYFALLPDDDFGDRAHYGDAGLTWLLNADTQLDARAGLNLGDAGDFFFGVGVARRW